MTALDDLDDFPQDAGAEKDAIHTAVAEAWTASLARKEQNLLKFILARSELRAALATDPIVELRASGDSPRRSLLPTSASVEVNSRDAAEAQHAVNLLGAGIRTIIIDNVLQFLTETRQFLGACFSKLQVGGFIIIIVPHQFLYERKLRLPSRRNPLHRRFYTPNTLLADIEEAIDPCECRIRFLGENDVDYNYGAALQSDPEGGQDIVVAMERIARPIWRQELDGDEYWTQPREAPLRFPEVKPDIPSEIWTIESDPRKVSRLIILKLDHRGDFLMATEAFKTFRSTFSGAEITLVCGPWNVMEAEKSGFFDKIIPFRFFPEDDSAQQVMQSREVLAEKFAKRMEYQSYDLAVDLRLFDDTRPLLERIKARDRAGFDRYDSFPWMTIRLNTPSSTEDDRAEERVIAADHFSTSLGRHPTFEIRLDTGCQFQSNTAVIWGPYEHLAPGRYQLECLIEPLHEEFDVAFDVAANVGSRQLLKGSMSVRRKEYPTVQLSVAEKAEKFEFRIFGEKKLELKPFRFFGVRLARQGVVRGVHQSEAMALLAQLVRLRMVNPYKVELL